MQLKDVHLQTSIISLLQNAVLYTSNRSGHISSTECSKSPLGRGSALNCPGELMRLLRPFLMLFPQSSNRPFKYLHTKDKSSRVNTDRGSYNLEKVSADMSAVTPINRDVPKDLEGFIPPKCQALYLKWTFLWSPYGIGQSIIFSSCGFFFFFFLLLSSSFFFFFPRLISAVADWMSAILPHMVWP